MHYIKQNYYKCTVCNENFSNLIVANVLKKLLFLLADHWVAIRFTKYSHI